jgi:seryl-tRNA synthetase
LEEDKGFEHIQEIKNYVSPLIGILLAVTRTIAALLENHQQKEGSIYVPEDLQPNLKNRDSFKTLLKC